MSSRSWNRIELIGNLTRDPEMRFTPSSTAVATSGLATNRTYTSNGEKKEEVDFHKIVAWGKLAEVCSQLLKKGSKVFISGRLQYREWTTQEGGKRRDAEIVLEDMVLLTPKGGVYEGAENIPAGEVPEAHQEEEAPPQKAPKAKEESKEKADENVALDEDLPF